MTWYQHRWAAPLHGRRHEYVVLRRLGDVEGPFAKVFSAASLGHPAT
ncbi:hypothetical protein OG883_38245 [Streptomyces sp. NBC_01142]|nr:hypothetical protein [Streptomyces sp. NBC_01142]MCX4825594.1 hypothetical protein [Streptomyces sp. NBC_01142]